MSGPRMSDGAAAGLQALEELGSAKLPAHTRALNGCLSPVMDVVLLFNTPPSGPAAAAAAPASTSHLSVAQIRMREMMLKRQQQAAAARAGVSSDASGDAAGRPQSQHAGNRSRQCSGGSAQRAH